MPQPETPKTQGGENAVNTEANTEANTEGRGLLAGLVEEFWVGLRAAIPPRWGEGLLLYATTAITVATALAVFVIAGPAFAQAAPNSCQGGGGGAGGRQILDAGLRLIQWGAAAVVIVGAGGFLGAGALKIAGALSETWQKRASSIAGSVAIGLFIAFGASAFAGLMRWGVCNVG